jgi:hypothetical protein
VVELVLLDDQLSARRTIYRSIAALAGVPIIVMFALVAGIWIDAFVPMVFAAFYSLIAGVVGTLGLGVGTVRMVRAKRGLRELAEARIPTARALR